MAHRRSPWPAVTTAPAKVRPRWVTSTSNHRGRASSTARVKTAWAERTVWSGSALEAATTAWASSWLPSTTRRVAPVARPGEATVGTGLHVEERQHPPDAGAGRVGPRPGGHRPDTAGVAMPTRTSTTSWKKARWPASRATSGKGSSYRQASTSTPPTSARR